MSSGITKNHVIFIYIETTSSILIIYELSTFDNVLDVVLQKHATLIHYPLDYQVLSTVFVAFSLLIPFYADDIAIFLIYSSIM